MADGAPNAYGPTDDEVSKQAITQAIESGVDFFDTSGLYGSGRAETLLGERLAPSSRVATKAGYLDASGQQNFQPDYLENQLRASLTRLRRGHADLFQLHDPPLEELTDELWSRLAGWREEGLCRSLGVSVRKPQDARQIVGRWPVDCIQLNYSLLDQRARVEGILDLCARNGVGVIARTPLAFGFLSGPVDDHLHASDHRNRWSTAQKLRWSEARSLFRETLGPDYAGGDVHLALAFCLAYPEIGVVIPGMLAPAQVQENLLSLQHPITLSQRSRLEQIYAQNDFFVSTKERTGS